MSYTYAGVNSRKLYSFMTPLVDVNGRPVVGGPYSTTTWNGEEVVIANRDGSVARGTAGPTPAGYPLSASTMPSPWEQAVPTNTTTGDDSTLPSDLPMELGNG